MALSIKDPEADRLAREVARRTGKTMTQAIVDALRMELDRLESRARPSLADDLMAIGQECASLPVLDSREPDEIIGYDEHGVPR